MAETSISLAGGTVKLNRVFLITTAAGVMGVSLLLGGYWLFSRRKSQILDKVEMESTPKSIEEMGYRFVQGKLININTREPFQWVDQRHFDILSSLVSDYIVQEIKRKYDLITITIPEDANDEPTSFFLASKNWRQSEKQIIIIPGGGALPGVWSRKAAIVDLNEGSMFSYLDKFIKNNTKNSVIILNPEQNFGKDDKSLERVRGSEAPLEHIKYVWDNFIEKSKSNQLFIIAHSTAGECIVALMRDSTPTRGKSFLSRVTAIAFIDSIHFLHSKAQSSYPDITDFLKKKSKNWMTSSLPLDQPITIPPSRLDSLVSPCVSSGHFDPAYTATSVTSSISLFFDSFSQNSTSS